ncbi:hypothetical protein U1Q18_014258, partial [Sarracenia purpurea var. burkii]
SKRLIRHALSVCLTKNATHAAGLSRFYPLLGSELGCFTSCEARVERVKINIAFGGGGVGSV